MAAKEALARNPNPELKLIHWVFGCMCPQRANVDSRPLGRIIVCKWPWGVSIIYTKRTRTLAVEKKKKMFSGELECWDDWDALAGVLHRACSV